MFPVSLTDPQSCRTAPAEKNSNFWDFDRFGSILLVLQILVCHISISLAHDEKKLVRAISPRNRAVGVGNRPETGGELQTRSAAPPNSPSNSKKKTRKIAETKKKGNRKSLKKRKKTEKSLRNQTKITRHAHF